MNAEETLFSVLGDKLYLTKKEESETLAHCSATDRDEKKNKQELENCRKELNELYSQNKHQYINGKIREVESVYKGQAKKCGK